MRHLRDGRAASVCWVCGVCTLGVRHLRAGRAASARPQHNPVPDRFKCSNTICYWSLVSAGQEVVATETELAALPKRQRQVVVLDIIILVGCTPHPPQRAVTPPNATPHQASCAICVRASALHSPAPVRLVSRRQAPVLMTPAAVVAGKGGSVRPISSASPPVCLGKHRSRTAPCLLYRPMHQTSPRHATINHAPPVPATPHHALGIAVSARWACGVCTLGVRCDLRTEHATSAVLARGVSALGVPVRWVCGVGALGVGRLCAAR